MLDTLDTVIIRDLVASLPPGERTLAQLIMAGHTQASAARSLGITARAARYRMHRIRLRLAASTGLTSRTNGGMRVLSQRR